MTKRERLQQVVLPLIRCIDCNGSQLTLTDSELTCASCGRRYPVHQNIPIMIDNLEAAITFDPAVVVENGYSEQWKELINRAGDGYVLDLGAGNNPTPHQRLIKLDIFALPNVDVVGIAERLPFRDAVFQAVMSGAVFEHVKNPFESISEVRRVLQEGGEVYIETAFLQPVHAFPSHYFNMTRMGLEHICKDFVRIDAGVQPHQYPSFALHWFLNDLVRKLPKKAKKDFMKAKVVDILDEFNDNPFGNRWLNSLSPEDCEKFACGVYFYGFKAGANHPSMAPLPIASPPLPPPQWRLALRRIKRFVRRKIGV